MKTPPSNIIAISYAKRVLEAGSRERRRMQAYAAHFQTYHIIVFTKASEGLVQHAQIGALHVHGTHARTRLGMLLAAIRIGRRLVRETSGGDCLVTSQDPFETSVVGRAIAFGNRALHHVQLHGDLFNPRSHSRSLLSYLRLRYGWYIVRTAKCIRVVSHRIERSLIERGVKRSRIAVVPIQADLDAFLRVGRERARHTKSAPRFLYVGRFSSEKNLPLLIDAFAAATTHYPDATLTLVGDGPETPAIEKAIDAHSLHDRVSLRAWTNDVPGEMAEHDVFCLASDHEGWGMVLVEAAAARMAIITTDVGCAGEVIKHGAQGQVVPVGDEAQYAAAIEDYLVNPSHIHTHAENAHRAATRHALSEEEYVTHIVHSYASCL